DTAITERNTARSQRDTFETNLNAEKRETTRLNQFIRPTYANWELFVKPELNPNNSPPQNQFLQTTANVISRTGTNAPPQAIQTLNLSTATFDGVALGGEGDDGVAFFQGQINSTNYNYAGVFESTDLGRPPTNTAGTTAVWNGSFDHIFNSTDFALTITFDTNGGTLDAFVNAGHIGTFATRNFKFDNVRFDTRGLITGDVIYGTFAYNNPFATPSATIPSTLRGLIGEQGAVGVFVGEVGHDISGAFVAHPTATFDPNKVNFADWGGVYGTPKATVINQDNTGTLPLLNGVAGFDTTTSGGHFFIQGLATSNVKGFNLAGTNLAAFATHQQTVGGVLLLEAGSPSGIARGETVGGRYYAGLLPSTTLGAPITDPNTSAIWNAKLIGGYNQNVYPNFNFKMQVIFNGSTGTINSGTMSGQSFSPGVVSVPW
ncbi:MAG: hypothetical protein K8953_02925, partial [Proteobacteria bacterium]|nr:hypothetical protein [Pseudomonadota bacterium]